MVCFCPGDVLLAASRALLQQGALCGYEYIQIGYDKLHFGCVAK